MLNRIGPSALKRLSSAVFLLSLLAAFHPSPVMGGTLQVSWMSNSEADLAGYRLYYGTASHSYTSTVDIGLPDQVQVNGLDETATYFFAVTAYDQSGNESAPSDEVVGRIGDGTSPAPSVDQVIEVATGSVYAVRSLSHFLRVQGTGFAAKAEVSLGEGVTFPLPYLAPDGDLVLLGHVDADATLGPRTVTVTNPNQATTSLSDAMIVIRSPDFNGDCLVDTYDLNALARAWNETSQASLFTPDVDLDGDDYIGPDDLTIFVKFLGRPLPGCP